MKKTGKKRKDFWSSKKVVVTGGKGFLGSHLAELLKRKKPQAINLLGSQDYDLRKYEDCILALKDHDMVIHLAANVGGIGYNRRYPADILEDNLLIGLNTLKAAKDLNISKFVAVGTVCAYPKYAKIPFSEEDLWSGYPEETNAPYGLAKKMMLIQAQSYRKQYGFNAIYLIPVNLYGPGDNFSQKSSHVIPALIKKFVRAKKDGLKSIHVWGTGRATREFLYVDDCAKGILLAAEKYNKPAPVNLGTGREILIKGLVEKLRQMIYPEVKIIWDKSKPDGQPRRILDVSRAQKEFNFKARTSLQRGLEKTISWYLSQSRE